MPPPSDSAQEAGSTRPARVRVGIVSWNTAALLDRCLGSLPKALGDLEATVVVVDNASTDGSAEVAAKHHGVRVVRNSENRGYARAMNQALSEGEEEVLIALNPDTEPPPGSLARLVERLLAQPDVGLVAPRLLSPDASTQHSAHRFPSLAQAAVVCFAPARMLRRGLGRRWWLEGYTPHDRASDVDWAVGAVHVLRAAALDDRAPYDERWFMYVEDLDLCWRLARRGWRRRLEADVSVTHVGNAAGALAWGAGRTERWLAASLDWYARNRGSASARAWALLNALGIALALARLAPRVAARRLRGARGGTGARQLARSLLLHLRASLRGAPPCLHAAPEGISDGSPGAAPSPPGWRHSIALDHPPSAANRPRYGHGLPRHRGLEAALARHAGRYRAELAELAPYFDDLARIPARASEAEQPCWLNAWLLGMDTASLYGYVRRRQPARYVEVGSGESTKVVARARRDGGLDTRIVSIDPEPRTEIDRLCDTAIREPLELVDLELFASLEPGDVVFLDASHRVFMNSDMVAFYLDVLPELPGGVLVGIHDILWPDDYPPEWAPYWFSEQYLLGAYLLAGAAWTVPVLACNYASQDPRLRSPLEPLWERLDLPELDRRGFCFWCSIER